MIWQDYIIFGGQLILWLAVIPMLRSENKPPVLTSLSATIGLVLLVISFVTLGLWASTIITAISAGSWLALMIQRIRWKKNMVGLV